MEESSKKLKALAQDKNSAPETIKETAANSWTSTQKITAFIIMLAVAVIAAVIYSKIHPQDPCDLYPDLQCGKYAQDGGGSPSAGYRTCILNLVGGGLPECSDGTHGGDGLPKKTLINGKLYDQCRYVSATGVCEK